jgi:Tfp pilus assembly protein FimT
MFKNFHKNKYNSGVTLIELIVVIIIFMIISSITIFNYGNLNSSLSTQNLADDIALSIRRAQGYAVGVRGYSGLFNEGYGIHFTTNPDISKLYAGSNKSFILFADMTTQNQKYDYGSYDKCGSPKVDNECIEVLNITSTDSITAIYLSSDINTPISSTSTVDILFHRPNSEPTFCYRSSSSVTGCEGNPISFVKIKVTSLRNPQSFRTITVSNNGQISVF